MCSRRLETAMTNSSYSCCGAFCHVGAVFALMNHPSVCQEMVRELVLDLPLLSSPVILLCMNKELRNQCMRLLQRDSSRLYVEGKEKTTRERSKTSAGTEMMFV